jgi:crotonobetainyl-CoA:carnitine CoA-transferase CaiB-like acyl-CoA transferase
MMMAEQGAEVIKVEPVEQGDPMRYLGTAKGGISALFANCNRGKASVRMNLRDAEGQRLAARLAERCDVVIHNFRPGVMDRLGLGSEALRRTNPRLVDMAISGFGKQGPLKDAPAYDPVIQAHGGFAASQGVATPAFVRNLMCDKITAYTALQAVTAALYQRERTGEGQHVDLSMLDAGVFFLFPDAFMNETLLDGDAIVQPRLADLIYQLTLTRDGGITLSTGTPRQREGLLKALELDELIDDPRFATTEQLMSNLDSFRALVGNAFATRETDEILARLQHFDVPAAKCLSLDEVIAHPQLAANGSIGTCEHPHMGAMRVMHSPAEFGGERLTPAAPAPAHGEPTDTVLTELGILPEQLAQVRENGPIGGTGRAPTAAHRPREAT